MSMKMHKMKNSFVKVKVRIFTTKENNFGILIITNCLIFKRSHHKSHGFQHVHLFSCIIYVFFFFLYTLQFLII